MKQSDTKKYLEDQKAKSELFKAETGPAEQVKINKIKDQDSIWKALTSKKLQNLSEISSSAINIILTNYHKNKNLELLLSECLKVIKDSIIDLSSKDTYFFLKAIWYNIKDKSTNAIKILLLHVLKENNIPYQWLAHSRKETILDFIKRTLNSKNLIDVEYNLEKNKSDMPRTLKLIIWAIDLDPSHIYRNNEIIKNINTGESNVFRWPNVFLELVEHDDKIKQSVSKKINDSLKNRIQKLRNWNQSSRYFYSDIQNFEDYRSLIDQEVFTNHKEDIKEWFKILLNSKESFEKQIKHKKKMKQNTGDLYQDLANIPQKIRKYVAFFGEYLNIKSLIKEHKENLNKIENNLYQNLTNED